MDSPGGESSGFVLNPGGEESKLNGKLQSAAEVAIGRQLSEPGRFAYAALCGVSLGHLFPGSEQRSFRERYLEGLVQWLGLDESVMPVMQAFLTGLGGEGSDTFLSILQAEPLLSTGALPVTQDLVSFSVKDGEYDARARILIRHVSCLLRVCPKQLEGFEETLGERLRQGGEESEEESSRRRKKERGRALRRYLLIGLATVGGGTVLGVTGGLAAPLVAAGAGAVLGAGGAAVLGSVTGIAIMASLFGAAGAGLTGYKMNKRVGAIEEFEFLPLNSGKHLHVTVAVTGWLCSGKYSSFQAPWRSLDACGEQYCLKWESRYLMDLGSVLDTLWDGLVSIVAQEALKYTVLSGIVTALTWPASLLAVASVIDNPWGVCLSRSAEVGKHLAQVLRSRQQGKRPVSLIGFSLGARVIYFCLEELANDKGSEGVIEDVVLLGAPVDGSEKTWARLSKVVAGKIVNGYCRGDWLLGFVYRSSSVQLSVAGLQPINSNNRHIINVDLSSVVKGHLDYMRQMDTILVAVGVPTKEGAGTTPGHSQSVMLSEGKLDTPEAQPNKENGQHEENLIEASNKNEEANVKNELTETEGEQHSPGRAQENGWDIPDISDLLESLSVSKSEQKDSSFFTCTEDIEGSHGQCTQEEESQSDTASECISWEWETKHWTIEPTTTHHSKRTECSTQDQVAKGKQPFSATLPTQSLHSPVTEHTTTAHMDSEESKG
ncbi:transmembrane and coiled-coil domain-containing protein 4 isoform X2 [Neoarius graeffei]|uniref:transmembrane and coiled-coil domain-containing protein 4 isoform X2 n=1 Tax=Neoarius graeffei TaxID=443677 RepID=UPI00298D205F|nr:transmembrane and coiled-coil domain-containing protein 4 isoform X2 [Neoarius graeffei]